MSELRVWPHPRVGEKQLIWRPRPRCTTRSCCATGSRMRKLPEVLARWTGIPGLACWKAKREAATNGGAAAYPGDRPELKLSMPLPMRSAAVGLDCRIPCGRSVHSCFSARRGGQDRAVQGAGLNTCSTVRMPWCASICPNLWRSTVWRGWWVAPPGYVGYEEGGYLTEAVRRKPYSVILLD